jgi:hypothetical protein
MRLQKLATVAVAAFIAFANSDTFAAERFTFLTTQSEPGDALGLGQSEYFDLTTHEFYASVSADNYFGHLSYSLDLTVRNRPPLQYFTTYWMLLFRQNNTLQPFATGDYLTIPDRVTMAGETTDARGLQQPFIGNFQIMEYDFTNPDEPHLALNFEIHMRGEAPALRGQFRINSVFGVPEPSTSCGLIAGAAILLLHRRKTRVAPTFGRIDVAT